MLTLSITRTRSDRESTGAAESFGMAGFTVRASPEWPEIRVDPHRNRIRVAPPLSGRPFYYAVTQDGELFASTHIRFLRQAGIRLEENSEAFSEFLLYRIVTPPSTLYRNVRQLPSCYALEITVGRELALREEPVAFPAPEAGSRVAETAERLEAALARYLRQLDPERTAVLLSGGVDSTIICQISRRCGGKGITYSSSYPFELPALEVERGYAISAAEALSIPHRHYVPSHEEYLEGMIQAIAAAELPVHHLQSVLLHLLFRNGIDASYPNIVIGVGAGAVFGNVRNFLYWRRRYPWYRMAQLPPMVALLKLANRLAGGRGRYWLENLATSRQAGDSFPSDPDNPMWSWHAYGDPEWIRAHLGVSLQQIVGRKIDVLLPFQNRDLRDVWAIYSLLGDEQITQDIWYKIGRAQSRNVHFPFYDPEVLDLVFRLSWQEKLGPPENALRKALAERVGVPRFIRERPKWGFGLRRSDWATRGGVLERLVPVAIKAVDEAWVREVQGFDPSKAWLFWNLLNYGIWKRVCLREEEPEALIEELRRS
jgi:asparagine synthetase B (glutamine-hydrolysing)